MAPSGRSLARVMTSAVPRSGEPVVVELGPGTGAFTTSIQERLGGRGRHVAVELNERLARGLVLSHPGVDVAQADARALASVLAERGLSTADVVVSGLPWATFSARDQSDILSAVVAVLPPHGAFTTFAYVHARWSAPARRIAGALHAHFEEVVVGRTVWDNLPPALVYHCRRPVR
ncbi:ribosomal RNA adenine dimethylase [Streptomyces zinciresistens K42]|uniref:Ribosomal RNA adenine dimethylase n=1 Tax=Streptomyces zinciresistens K42 TaxID=700597 RepID=G2GNU0_9ACTN|nr:ribosomal RNA adenine dimethylase [Streptomyces zinciresistens K42]